MNSEFLFAVLVPSTHAAYSLMAVTLFAATLLPAGLAWGYFRAGAVAKTTESGAPEFPGILKLNKR